MPKKTKKKTTKKKSRKKEVTKRERSHSNMSNILLKCGENDKHFTMTYEISLIDDSFDNLKTRKAVLEELVKSKNRTIDHISKIRALEKDVEHKKEVIDEVWDANKRYKKMIDNLLNQIDS